MGRPSRFTAELQEEFLTRLENGESARAICRDPKFPSWSAFCRFKRKDEKFRDQYHSSWEDGFTAWEQEIIDISDDQTRDYQDDGKGGIKSDNTASNRDRLRIDTRKWIMSKRMPKVYGDKIEQQLTGKGGESLQVTVNIPVKHE